MIKLNNKYLGKCEVNQNEDFKNIEKIILKQNFLRKILTKKNKKKL